MQTVPELAPHDRFIGYLSFSLSYFFIIILTFGLPLGLVFFPRSIGLFVTLPYWTYTLTIGRYEMRDGFHRTEFSKNFFVFRAMRKLLRMEISPLPQELIDAEAKPNAQFVFAEFPHAVWADYHVSMDGLWPTVFPNIYPQIRSLTASILFRAPIIREWALWTSCIDASRHVAEAALDRGRTLLVRPGGEAEQLRTTRGREIVFLSKRKGFLKLALKRNVPVVPCYVFGASDYHFTWNGLFFRPREWLQKRFGVCLPIALGYWGSMCPLPVKTTVVFGKPLWFDVKERGNPSFDEVEAAHKQFHKALHSLFEEHKKALGYGDRELEIV
jgi:1-acyl-sn-glycerol-3-phosphate acyltransferase